MRAGGAVAYITTLALLGSACVRESTTKGADTLGMVPAPTATDSARPPVVVQDSAAVATARQVNESALAPLSCAPETFGPGDTLTLRMRVPHGDYLTVTPPSGEPHFIVYPQWDKPRRRYSLIPSDDFKRMSTLRLPSDVRAIVLVINRDTILDPVFAAPGKYILRMGENFEGDYSNVSYTCSLNFTQSSK